jgi:hypothetical protein
MNKIIAIQGAEGSNHYKVAKNFYKNNIQLKECTLRFRKSGTTCFRIPSFDALTDT